MPRHKGRVLEIHFAEWIGREKDWSGQDLSQEAEYVCLRRYPPAPNCIVIVSQPGASSDPYIYLWTRPGFDEDPVFSQEVEEQFGKLFASIQQTLNASYM